LDRAAADRDAVSAATMHVSPLLEAMHVSPLLQASAAPNALQQAGEQADAPVPTTPNGGRRGFDHVQLTPDPVFSLNTSF
jgi:hypothetical protein